MEINKKRILVIGSGMMVEPLIDYLLKREENHITIASDVFDVANAICIRKTRCIPEKLDVLNDQNKLENLVKSHNIVISFVPAFLHIHVARHCLQHCKNMVTASYISEEMKALDCHVKEKKLIFMNEIGLDPGIDHIVSHIVIDECKQNNSKIIAYESWCGALPSPDAIDNPLLYKFSWSPRGALNAVMNSVIFLEDGIEKEIKEEEVLLSTVEKKFHPCFNFEGYYNRNSVKYKDVYHLNNVKTLIRGTIRYKGFCFIIQCFKNLGLFNNEEEVVDDQSWRQFFERLLLSKSEDILKSYTKNGKDFKINLFELSDSDYEFYRKLVFLAIITMKDEYFIKNDAKILCSSFVEMLHFLNLNNYNLMVILNII